MCYSCHLLFECDVDQVIYTFDLCRPTKDWSPVPSASTQSHRISPILNHEALQNSNPLEPIYYNPAGTTHLKFPPSLTSLLMNCSPAVQQGRLLPMSTSLL